MKLKHLPGVPGYIGHDPNEQAAFFGSINLHLRYEQVCPEES